MVGMRDVYNRVPAGREFRAIPYKMKEVCSRGLVAVRAAQGNSEVDGEPFLYTMWCVCSVSHDFVKKYFFCACVFVGGGEKG